MNGYNTGSYQVPSYVAGRITDGELVVINLKNGLYYSSSGTGPAIWELLEAGCAVGKIATHLAGTFLVSEDQALADVVAFVDRLVAGGLLEDRETAGAGLAISPPASQDAAIGEKSAYEAPSLLTFDDMEQAFAMDPPLRA